MMHRKRVGKRFTGIVVTFLTICGSFSAGLASTAMAEEQNAEFIDGVRRTYVEATCEEPAYWLCEREEDGVITIEEEGTPLGHVWQTVGEQEQTCLLCGKVEDLSETDIPQIRINGSLEGISKEDRVMVPVQFISKDLSFDCFGYMSLQGHSTLNLPKKNYTLRLFDDEAREEKHKISFPGWQEEHKYILKAYMGDTTVCRDLVCAKIWGKIVKSRENIPLRLQQASNYGAVAGFPVTVWLQDEFLGLYTMNLHKDDDLYVMSKQDDHAVMIANAQSMPESLFRAESEFIPDVSDWEVEYSGDDDTAVRSYFNEMIRFIIDSEDQEFQEHLPDYLDVDAAIDYLLFIWTMGLKNNGAKDLVLLTYGEQWIPTVYDMEEGIGLVCQVDEFLPDLNEEMDSATGSLLWDRLLQNYTEQIRERYQSLRKGALSEEEILGELDRFWQQIPQVWREKDLDRYPGRQTFELEELENYLSERLCLLDERILE